MPYDVLPGGGWKGEGDSQHGRHSYNSQSVGLHLDAIESRGHGRTQGGTFQSSEFVEFPGGPVVRTLHSHCLESRCEPWLEK